MVERTIDRAIITGGFNKSAYAFEGTIKKYQVVGLSLKLFADCVTTFKGIYLDLIHYHSSLYKILKVGSISVF
jgi:hypothetical protein